MAKKATATKVGKKAPVSVTAEMAEQTSAEQVAEAMHPLEQTEASEVAARTSLLANGDSATTLPGTGINPTNQFVMEVDPDDVIVDPDLQGLRSWTGGSAQELAIPELARTILEEGQRELARAFQTDEGIVLFEGHRRRAAIKYIREEFDATFMLKIVVDDNMTFEQALRAALLADSQHEMFTEVERGRNIAMLRKRFGWQGAEGTGKIAQFLGVSYATVSQAEKLSRAPEVVKERVESGELSPTAALDMLAGTSNAPEGEERAQVQEKVLEVAKERAEKGKKKKLAKLTAAQKRAAANVRGSIKADKLAKQIAEEESKPAKIDSTHVRGAVKEVMGDQAKVKAPRMAEAIELIEPWTGPAYPEVMRKFADKFVEYGHGKATDKQLEAAWDDIGDALAGLTDDQEDAKGGEKVSNAATGRKSGKDGAKVKKAAVAKTAAKPKTTVKAPVAKTKAPVPSAKKKK